VLEEYEFHEEAKSADASGAPREKQTVGLLKRRLVTIRAAALHRQGIEQARRGRGEQSVSDAADVYTEYPDPRRREWALHILGTLRSIPLQALQRLSDLDRRSLQRIRGGQRPRKKNCAILKDIAESFAGLDSLDTDSAIHFDGI
jgi:hypothetical protein